MHSCVCVPLSRGVLLLMRNAQWIMLYFANIVNKTESEPKGKRNNFPHCKVSSLRYNAVWDNFKTAFVCQGRSVVLVQGRRLDYRLNKFKID